MNTSFTNSDDLELIERYKNTHDIHLVGVLFQRYTHLILGVCMKYLKDEEEANDTSVQIFEKLLTDMKKHEVRQFKAWLHMVCKNHCLIQLRSGASKNRRDREMYKDLAAMESGNEMHPVTENTKEVQLNYMEDCMGGLNDEQRLCIELFYLQEKSYQEVSDSTNFSMNHVKSYIQNGKRNLKNCIESRMSAN